MVAALLVGFIVWKAFWGGGDEHPHELGPHGGIVVAINKDEPHYHVEVVVEKGGVIRLYTFGEETDEALEVEPRFLIADTMAAGDTDPTSVILRPVPQPKDAGGKTSQFVGRLPTELLGKRLAVTIPHLGIRGQVFRFSFNMSSGDKELAVQAVAEEKKLLLNPGGKYTEADIKANGQVTVSEQFKGVRLVHELRPAVGDKICPVTRVKANARISWVVGRRTYRFCCPPCIVDFVQHAKERPEQIQAPEEFVQKD
ncbi:MAG: hypothetical protein L0Z62_03465 [Gemmataceae bacterium]|nr:hypothetical protein [Gemmataceae bacterium]